MRNKKYLVTGGLGFLGSELVKRLVKNKHHVRILDNASRGTLEKIGNFADKIEVINADIRDFDSVHKACKGVDSVIHLAFINGTEFFYTKPELVLEVGVKGIVNVIDACIKESIPEFILASSSEVYQTPNIIPTNEKVPMTIPDPLNPRYSYAGGKIISELMTINYARKYFERAIIFRPHNVYGPNMGWEHVIPQFVLRMKDICQKTKSKQIKFPIHGTGKETRSFVFIDDFINGLMIVLEKGKHLEIYNIGTQDEMKIGDVAVEIGRYFKREVQIVPGKPAKGGTPRRCPDITKIKKLGYRPKVTFKEGLAITAKWYDKNSHKRPKSKTLNEHND